jgi:hypothetical protein
MIPKSNNVNSVGKLIYTSSHGPQLPSQGFVRGVMGANMDVDQLQVGLQLNRDKLFIPS